LLCGFGPFTADRDSFRCRLKFWRLMLMNAVPFLPRHGWIVPRPLAAQTRVRVLKSSLAKEKIYHHRPRLAAISGLNHVPEKFANSSINALCLFGRIDERTAAVLMASS
jgi:hypothetical protein